MALSAPWLAAAVGTAAFAVVWHPNFVLAVPLVLATAVHELGHAAAARALGVGVHRIEVGLLTGRVRLSALPDDASLAKLTLAGPAAHAALGLATLALGGVGRHWLVIGGFVVLHAL
ncbi:MAG: M50 family metallopeptidase, partial [Myxococcota bacterium]